MSSIGSRPLGLSNPEVLPVDSPNLEGFVHHGSSESRGGDVSLEGEERGDHTSRVNTPVRPVLTSQAAFDAGSRFSGQDEEPGDQESQQEPEIQVGTIHVEPDEGASEPHQESDLGLEEAKLTDAVPGEDEENGQEEPVDFSVDDDTNTGAFESPEGLGKPEQSSPAEVDADIVAEVEPEQSPEEQIAEAKKALASCLMKTETGVDVRGIESIPHILEQLQSALAVDPLGAISSMPQERAIEVLTLFRRLNAIDIEKVASAAADASITASLIIDTYGHLIPGLRLQESFALGRDTDDDTRIIPMLAASVEDLMFPEEIEGLRAIASERFDLEADISKNPHKSYEFMPGEDKIYAVRLQELKVKHDELIEKQSGRRQTIRENLELIAPFTNLGDLARQAGFYLY